MTMPSEYSVNTRRALGAVDDWVRLTPTERASLCLDLAAEAQNCASHAGPETKEDYLAIAANWIQLANEIKATIGYLPDPLLRRQS